MKILIVDDSLLNRTFAKDYIIKSVNSVDLFYASNGYEALEIVKSEQVDIVLLDIIMPKMDGIETLRNFKEKGLLEDMKVIMYSSSQEMEKLRLCFELGAVDFIRKPIEEIEFISRLNSIIKQKQNETEMKLYIGEIEQQKSIIMSTNLQLIQAEKMAGIGHLAAGVAHEINNPIGFITSNIEVLKDYIYTLVAFYDLMVQTGKADKELNKVIESFCKQFKLDEIFEDLTSLYEETISGLSRVTKIVQSLRNFASTEIEDDFQPYNLNSGIEDTLVIANSYIKYNAVLEVNYGHIPEMIAAKQQINQVILNLLLNSVDALKEKDDDTQGRIVISTSLDEGHAILKIKDYGVGIDHNHFKSLFNPFFTTKPVGTGLGLGLSIAYDIIVTKHKGQISFESEEGEWTEVTVRLPLEPK